MKTKSFVLAAILMIFIVAVFLLVPARSVCQGKSENMSGSIPPDLYKIFENSCMSCHANGGKPMAMSHINFSHWNEYTPEKQAKNAADIERMLMKGAMPPKSFRASRPDAVPTEEQVKMIAAWADKLNPKK